MSSDRIMEHVFRCSGVPGAPSLHPNAGVGEGSDSGVPADFPARALPGCALPARPEWRLVLGPPGCGKTHALVKFFRERVAAGVPPDRIACLAFSRAGKRELLERLGGDPSLTKSDLAWVRTIHSAALRLLREHSLTRIMGEREWQEFSAKHHYHFTRVDEDDAADEPELRVPPRLTSDDALRHAYDWGRNLRLSPAQTLAGYRCAALRPDQFEAYVRRYEALKRERLLSDFLDLLEDVLEQGLRPDVEVFLIDEAQELSPLQLAVLAQWTADCPHVCLGGDDDQAVHGFQGGDSAWLVELSRQCRTTILTKSWRVPAAAHALAQRLIARNRLRVQKVYYPTSAAGEVLRLSLAGTYPLLDGSCSTFVLARNRIFLRPVAKELIARLVPFVVEGGGAPSPLSNKKLVAAVGTATVICRRDGARFSAASLAQLLEFVPTGALATKETRAALHAAARVGTVLSVEVMVAQYGLGPLLEYLYSAGPFACFEGIPQRTRRYLAGLQAKYGEIPEPCITLTSIHGSKGREAKLVVVLADMSTKSYRQYVGKECEEENRIFYVAVTRTRDTLVLVDPQGRKHFDFPRVDRVAGAQPSVGGQQARGRGDHDA